MRKLNSKGNFYFIKTLGKLLNENLNKLIANNSVNIVQSNFPDSIFLPLAVFLYGRTNPELVLFIEGEELIENNTNNLINWVDNAYKNITFNNYDYIFGNSQVIKSRRVVCSLLLSKASIIEHLLYYTDSNRLHANPFIRLSLASQTIDFVLSFLITQNHLT